MAKKKITLEILASRMEKGFANVETRMEKGFSSVNTKMERGFTAVETKMENSFAAVAEDMADIKRDMATKEQLISLHMQTNSIETEIRDLKRKRVEI